MGWFNLGKILDKRGWSMRQFADQLKVRPQVVSRYFKQGFDPNASTLLKWCKALDCPLEDLLDEKLDESEKLMPRPITARKSKGEPERRKAQPTQKKKIKKR